MMLANSNMFSPTSIFDCKKLVVFVLQICVCFSMVSDGLRKIIRNGPSNFIECHLHSLVFAYIYGFIDLEMIFIDCRWCSHAMFHRLPFISVGVHTNVNFEELPLIFKDVCLVLI